MAGFLAEDGAAFPRLPGPLVEDNGPFARFLKFLVEDGVAFTRLPIFLVEHERLCEIFRISREGPGRFPTCGTPFAVFS